MKRYWRSLSLATSLIVIIVVTIGVGGASAQTVCGPATAISAPFSFDGPGTYCWQSTSLCNYINSWNTTSIQVNGTTYTNTWVSSGSIAPLNGTYTIRYQSDGAYGHFEMGGSPCSSGPTKTPTQIIGASPTRTSTPALTATRTRTATNGPSLTSTRTATITLTRTATATRTITLTPTASSTGTEYYVNIALITNFPEVYIGGDDMMATVSTNIQNAMFSLAVIDTATGLEQSLTNPVLSPARPASQPANEALGNLVNFSLDGVRPGTVFFRATVTGQMCTPICAQGSITKDSPSFTVVSGATPTRTPTPTRTSTPPLGPCSPVNATIASPFVQDGIGNFCWQVSDVATFITSNNTASVNINGVNFTNIFAVPSSFPAKVNGFWYITYIGNFPWSHFEAK